MSQGFGPREGKIADPVSLVESVYEFDSINLPKSNKPTFVQYESDANKNTVKNNSKKFELLPDIGTGFTCVYADIHEGNSWFDAFLMIMSPKYRDLSVKDRHNVAKAFRERCAGISDSILNQIPDEFFVVFKVDDKSFKSELEGSKEINMGFGFFIAWYFGLNLVYLEQSPGGHEIIGASCYQSEECHAIFMKTYLDRFNAVVVLNLNKGIYNEEESTSVFEWADKRLCKLRKLSETVDKNTAVDTHWEFPISEECNPASTPSTSGAPGAQGAPPNTGNPAPEKKYKIGDTVRCRAAKGIQESKPFIIDEYSLMPNNKWKVIGLDTSGKKWEYGESGCELVNNTPAESASADLSTVFGPIRPGTITPETPLPQFKPGLLLLENGSVTNTDDNVGTALAILNPSGLTPLTLSSEAQEFIDRLKQLGNPEYPLSVADMAVITRFLELRKAKAPKKDQLLLEGSQQLLLEDIKKENLSSINPSSQANRNAAEEFFAKNEGDEEGEVTPETPLPHFKPGLLLLKNGSVTNTNDSAETALALLNPKGLKPLKLSSEAQEFLARGKEILRNPKYKLSVADKALLARLLELLKAKAPKKDQLLLEDSQQLFLKDIEHASPSTSGDIFEKVEEGEVTPKTPLPSFKTNVLLIKNGSVTNTNDRAETGLVLFNPNGLKPLKLTSQAQEFIDRGEEILKNPKYKLSVADKALMARLLELLKSKAPKKDQLLLEGYQQLLLEDIKKENLSSINPSSQANRNAAEEFFAKNEGDEEGEVTPETPLPHFKPGLLLLKNGSVTNTNDSAETALALLNPKGLKPLKLTSQAQEFIDRGEEILKNPKYKLSVADKALMARLLELLKSKAPKKDQLLLEGYQQLLLEDIKDASPSTSGDIFEKVEEGKVTPKTPLPSFKTDVLLIKNGSVTNTNDSAETALALFNQKGLTPLKLSSEAQEFLARGKEILRNPKYKLSVADKALLARLLELLKAKAPKKDQLLLEDSQQLFLKDIIREFVEPEEEAPVQRPSIFNRTSNSPRVSFGPAQTRKNKKVKPNNVSTLRNTVPNTTRKNNKPTVARNNTSKLRIKAPTKEELEASALRKSQYKLTQRKEQPPIYPQVPTLVGIHRSDGIGLLGSTGAQASSKPLTIRNTRKNGVLNPKRGWRP